MSLFRRFRRDRRGAVAIIFALGTIPLVAVVGVALDYSRMVSFKTRLQQAADSTALMVSREAELLNYDAAKAKAQEFFASNIALHANEALGAVAVDMPQAGIVKLTVSGTIGNAVMQIFGYGDTTLTAESETTWGRKNIEVAMVLDNTGSMNQPSAKIIQLRAAAEKLVVAMKELRDKKPNITVKVALVPYDTQVLLPKPSVNPTWIEYVKNAGNNTAAKNFSDWEGCVVDRPKNADVTGDPSAGKFPAVKCKSLSKRVAARPLRDVSKTADYNDLIAAIKNMQPMGNTNITLGTVWGHKALLPGDPLNGGADAPNSKDTYKYMVLLTDGENTENRFGDGTTTIDARTKLACANAQQSGIVIHSILLVDGDPAVLKSCANGNYYFAKTADELAPIFKDIADNISALRLTN